MFVVLISILVIMYQTLNILIFVPYIYQASFFFKTYVCIQNKLIKNKQIGKRKQTK